MQSISIRTMAAIAFDHHGVEEFDPAMAPSLEMLEELSVLEQAALPVEAPSEYDRRRQQDRQRRAQTAAVPGWFEAQDLVGWDGEVVHGELI